MTIYFIIYKAIKTTSTASPSTLKPIYDLKHLNRTILEIMFNHLAEQTTINLSNLGINTIHEDTFNGLFKLEAIFLKNNQLKKVDFNLKDLHKLKYISFESNQIVQFEITAFVGLNNLELGLLFKLDQKFF